MLACRRILTSCFLARLITELAGVRSSPTKPAVAFLERCAYQSRRPTLRAASYSRAYSPIKMGRRHHSPHHRLTYNHRQGCHRCSTYSLPTRYSASPMLLKFSPRFVRLIFECERTYRMESKASNNHDHD